MFRRSTRVLRVLGIVVAALSLAGCAEEESGQDHHDLTWWGPETLGPEPSGSPTRHPIVLASGFATSRQLFNFFEVADALRHDGHTVYEAEVPPYAAADVRAAHLKLTVDRALADGAQQVNIIAHSMGGLDARALVSWFGYGDRVRSITTISSPHRGSAMADAALGWIGGDGARWAAINALAEIVGDHISDGDFEADMRNALVDISEGNAQHFNEVYPNDDRVYYASWAGTGYAFGVRNPNDDDACGDVWFRGASGQRPPTDVLSPLLVASSAFVTGGWDRIPNDGLVTVESAKWGDFRGCIPADHADQVGQVAHRGPDAVTGFDHIRFYRNMAFEYASWGL